MRYSDAESFRIALETRLNARAREAGKHRSVDRLRKIIAFERLLARLMVVAPDGWAIKGGLALEFRYGFRARLTRDLDIGILEPFQQLSDVFIDATLQDLDDYFEFDVHSMRMMAIEDTDGIQRCRIRVLLAGRRFESLTVDVGMNHGAGEHIQMIGTTNLLDFAGFEPVVVPALPLEVHVAEKLHAYTRSYGEGRQNTRVKDLIDLVLIPTMSNFELGLLRSAIAQSFAERGTQSLPPCLPKPGQHWRIPYADLAREVELPEDLNDGFTAAAAFLDPVLAPVGSDTLTWDPVHWEWRKTVRR